MAFRSTRSARALPILRLDIHQVKPQILLHSFTGKVVIGHGTPSSHLHRRPTVRRLSTRPRLLGPTTLAGVNGLQGQIKELKTLQASLWHGLQWMRVYRRKLDGVTSKQAAKQQLISDDAGRQMMLFTWHHKQLREAIEDNADPYVEYLNELAYLVVGSDQTEWLIKWLLSDGPHVKNMKERMLFNRWRGSLLNSTLTAMIFWNDNASADEP